MGCSVGSRDAHGGICSVLLGSERTARRRCTAISCSTTALGEVSREKMGTEGGWGALCWWGERRAEGGKMMIKEQSNSSRCYPALASVASTSKLHLHPSGEAFQVLLPPFGGLSVWGKWD